MNISINFSVKCNQAHKQQYAICSMFKNRQPAAHDMEIIKIINVKLYLIGIKLVSDNVITLMKMFAVFLFSFDLVTDIYFLSRVN